MTNRYLEKIAAINRTLTYQHGKRVAQLMEAAGNRVSKLKASNPGTSGKDHLPAIKKTLGNLKGHVSRLGKEGTPEAMNGFKDVAKGRSEMMLFQKPD